MHTIENKPDTRERIRLLSKKDLELSYFAGPGKGGQAKNKLKTGCMIRHIESGAMAKASDARSLEDNRRTAFERLVKTPQMKFWLAKKLFEIRQGETMEEEIERSTRPENLKIEIRGYDNKWEVVGPEYFDTDKAKKIVDNFGSK